MSRTLQVGAMGAGQGSSGFILVGSALAHSLKSATSPILTGAAGEGRRDLSAEALTKVEAVEARAWATPRTDFRSPPIGPMFRALATNLTAGPPASQPAADGTSALFAHRRPPNVEGSPFSAVRRLTRGPKAEQPKL